MKRTIEIDLQYQATIDGPPPHMGNLYTRACSGDGVTIDSWRDTWIKNYKATKDRFGSFESRSYGQLFGLNRHKPCIVIGSGPSLKNHIDALRKNQAQDHPIKTISCLHNFGYFEDEGIYPDYYLSLDAGKIVLDDVAEGRTKDSAYYWDRSKERVLLASAQSDPSLFDAWKGDVKLFNCLVPDLGLREEFGKVERFSHYISSGGNALGACTYTAKAVLGSTSIIIVGGDFCFDYSGAFHSYPTHYDSKGVVIPWVDVFRMPRVTWQSYMNFKFWFDWLAGTVPGEWISCSEGIMGAYIEGNIKQFKYGALDDVLERFRMTDKVKIRRQEPGIDEIFDVSLSEMFKDSKQPMDLTLF